MHQCYYCDQIFDSKEDLYEHSEVHSDSDRNKEIKDRQRKLNQAQKITKKKQSKSQNKSNLDEHIRI